ncbi:hypothetical protein ABZ686_25785, partial [Streptomyces sp. NPDC006992]
MSAAARPVVRRLPAAAPVLAAATFGAFAPAAASLFDPDAGRLHHGGAGPQGQPPQHRHLGLVDPAAELGE